MLKALSELFWTFAKVGVMTFGGGYAMLPILQREVVENKHWATDEELTDYFAIGQCTPGVIAVNTATFIGQKNQGIIGGIVATLGVVFPSLVIISILAGFISSFSHLPLVINAGPGPLPGGGPGLHALSHFPGAFRHPGSPSGDPAGPVSGKGGFR